MAGFDEAWAAVDHPREGEPVSPELQPLLRRVYSEVLTAPADLAALKESLTADGSMVSVYVVPVPAAGTKSVTVGYKGL